MKIPWRATELSVSPPSIAMADTDRRALRFDAGEPITGASVDVRDMGAGASAPDVVESTAVQADHAIVTVSGLVRDHVYELAVTFARADTTAWTKVLVIRCLV